LSRDDEHNLLAVQTRFGISGAVYLSSACPVLVAETQVADQLLFCSHLKELLTLQPINHII